MISLTKRMNVGSTPIPQYSDTLQDMNKAEVKCERCAEVYVLGFSHAEKDHNSDLLIVAQSAVNASHQQSHPIHLRVT